MASATQIRQAEKRRRRAQELREQGKRPAEIAATLGVNLSTVSVYLHGRNGDSRHESKMTDRELFRRYLSDATAAVEEARELAPKIRLGVVTCAALNAAAESLRAARHGEALHKRAR